MKVLVCGSRGMLGADVMEVFAAKGHTLLGVDIQELDITDIKQVRRTFQQFKPDLVFNCAAYTDVDGCEGKPDLAYRVNALGPRNLAVTAEEAGSAIVQISTDYVFGGGAEKPYREFDPLHPQCMYGKSKADGELMVRAHCSRHFIIRTAWLFGPNGGNFVKTILRLAREQEALRVVNDQRGSPTYTGDLAQAAARLCEEATYGTYHLTNSGECTWYEFAREILKQSGLGYVKLDPITTEELNRQANRPSYSVMENYLWVLDGRPPLRPWQEALAHYLNTDINRTKEA